MTGPIRFTRRTLLATGCLSIPLGAVGQVASNGSAPAFPGRSIRLLVGYSAGGGVDAMARLLAPRLSAQLGQQVIVENRAGASGSIAADFVARAAPDGYTLFLADSATLIAQYMQAKLPFDPIRSFTPVAGVFSMPLVIVTSNDFPATTPRDLVAVLKANPGKYSFGTSGVGTVQHLGFEMMKAQTGAFVVHIPYRGAAQIVPDVISGQVPIGVVSATAAMAQAKAGKLKAVAIMSPVKLAGADDLQSLSTALPGFDVAPRLFLLAPAGLPQPIAERLGEAVRAVMAAPDLASAAAAQGAVPAFVPAGALGPSLAGESARWRQLIRARKISVE
ncbi:MAG: tripartite tricarboxylate transporter substrate-binding protein [Pseudomonadota bacterium]|nr:tripartite tricarboxylate transporter substrate-binding protein [Pseudomonadota bacterium]